MSTSKSMTGFQRMRCFLIFFLLAAALEGFATEKASETGIGPVSLSDLARKADLVVLAQARDTDYLTRREIPVSGSAYFKVLIRYKTDSEAEIIEVYEKGLHDNECYFPNPTVFEEGRRYLLFLKRDPEDEKRYLGLAEGCALDVLVDSNNRYALRFPATGIDLSDPLLEYAQQMKFSDGYAVVDDESLPPALRDAMLAAGQIVPFERKQEQSSAQPSKWSVPQEPPGLQWRYTMGISLATLRELIGPDALAD